MAPERAFPRRMAGSMDIKKRGMHGYERFTVPRYVTSDQVVISLARTLGRFTGRAGTPQAGDLVRF